MYILYENDIKNILEKIQEVVKDTTNNNDLVWINEGCDINNHLFTCIKYAGDSWYSQGQESLHWNKWKSI